MKTEPLYLSALLEARDAGLRLEGGLWTPYAGEEVEHDPRVDEPNGHPDFYPWHVVGRPQGDRLSCRQIVAKVKNVD